MHSMRTLLARSGGPQDAEILACLDCEGDIAQVELAQADEDALDAQSYHSTLSPFLKRSRVTEAMMIISTVTATEVSMFPTERLRNAVTGRTAV